MKEFRPLVLTVLDIWLPMAMGCATVIAPAERMKDVEAVRGLIARHGVTCMTTVPSMFQVPTDGHISETCILAPSLPALYLFGVADLCHVIVQALLDTCDGPLPLTSLCYVNLGGEVIYPTTLVQARTLAPNAQLGNVYGPTEASVFNSSWPCDQHDGTSFVPLGGCVYINCYSARTPAIQSLAARVWRCA